MYCTAIYYKLDNNNAFRVSSINNLQHISYFSRNYAKEFIHFTIREVVKSHDANNTDIFSTVTHTHSNPKYNYKMNILTENFDYFFLMITNFDYDVILSRRILCDIAIEFRKLQITNKIIPKYITADSDFNSDFINDIIAKYANTETVGKIKQDLNELTDVMKQNINILLERDIKIQDLLAKTQDLSEQSKQFKKAATKLNSCCFWW